MWNGRRIAQADWVRASTAPQVNKEQAASGGRYGYLWHVENEPDIAIYDAAGAWCQLVMVFPSRRVVGVITADDSAGWDEARVCDDLWPIVVEVLFEPLTS